MKLLLADRVTFNISIRLTVEPSLNGHFFQIQDVMADIMGDIVGPDRIQKHPNDPLVRFLFITYFITFHKS